MPHINIKYFSSIDQFQKEKLSIEIERVIANIFNCEAGVISIAFEPIKKDRWYEQVYLPEIIIRKELLHKLPDY